MNSLQFDQNHFKIVNKRRIEGMICRYTHLSVSLRIPNRKYAKAVSFLIDIMVLPFR